MARNESRGRRCTLLLAGALVATTVVAADGPVPVTPGSVVRWVGAGTSSCTLDERVLTPIEDTCYLAIDLRRSGELVATRTRDGQKERLRLRIGPYPYSVQRLHTEDESRVHLSAADAARVQRENRRIGALWSRGGERRFTLPLASPLDELPQGGRFGAKRIINGEPRSPHSGADFAAPRGTPVKATAAGTVALAEEHFFAGNSVFIDHGDGLISMYFHLDTIEAQPGQEVAAGEVVGTVGSTGRATGPHLHFALRWHHARVDPNLLLGPTVELALVE